MSVDDPIMPRSDQGTRSVLCLLSVNSECEVLKLLQVVEKVNLECEQPLRLVSDLQME